MLAQPVAPMDGPSEAARQQARAEGLTLLNAENTAGYFGVNLNKPGQPKPYDAKVRANPNPNPNPIPNLNPNPDPDPEP